ncbi:cell division topological specificity factor MinE [uncultured Jannaschia sp.]|uniref:cell division topological specificity factor MinE n=1 Tax=uncultured Jannaschia sp. TaxID=293347 RepID=UPI00260F284B|nr:cell division topological specificity factor MinE [uncultured Jannaschia sp.]
MFGFFRQQPRRTNSAQAAKERLQILLAHDRSDRARSDLLPLLQRDILEVVRRHMQVDSNAVEIKLERGDDMSSLEINIEVPDAQPRQAG